MEKQILHAITDSILFTRIFRAFRMAIQPAKLIIAFAAILAICALGLLMDLTKPAVMAPYSSPEVSSAPGQSGILSTAPTELHAYIASPSSVDDFYRTYSASGRTGVFNILSRFCAARFNDAALELVRLNPMGAIIHIIYCGQAVLWAISFHYIYSTIFFAASFVIICFAGGAICRIAALQFAQDEKPGVLQALTFAASKARSLIAAPVAPIVMLIIFGIPLIIIGLIGNIPYAGELIMSLLLGIGLIFAFLMSLLVIAMLGGVNLMIPAIAFESTDSFEAISRAFAYIFARPWRIAFYTVIAAIYGSVCYLFVLFFSFLMLRLSKAFLRLGLWCDSPGIYGDNKLDAIWPNAFQPPILTGFTGLNTTETIASVIISIIVLVVLGFVAAFVMSFVFCANSIIYALARNIVDRTSLKEVWTQSTATPQPPTPDQLPRDS